MKNPAGLPQQPEAPSHQSSLDLGSSRVWLLTLIIAAAIFCFSIVIIVFEHELRAAKFWILILSTLLGVGVVWGGLLYYLKLGLRLAVQTLLVLMIVVAAMFSFIYGDVVREQAGSSYLAVFTISFIGAATVILPAPAALTTISFAGALDSPFLVGLVAAFGQVAGESISYYVGSTGKQLIRHGPRYEGMRRALEQKSKLAGGAIFIFAAVPNPFFDAVGILAGALRYSFWRFLLLAFIGNAFKYILIFAVIGVRILDAIPRL